LQAPPIALYKILSNLQKKHNSFYTFLLKTKIGSKKALTKLLIILV